MMRRILHLHTVADKNAWFLLHTIGVNNPDYGEDDISGVCEADAKKLFKLLVLYLPDQTYEQLVRLIHEDERMRQERSGKIPEEEGIQPKPL